MLILVDGKQIRGDLILSASLRSDLAPIPLTFEGDFRADGTLADSLKEGKTINVAGDDLIIIKYKRVTNPFTQGGRVMEAVRVIAVLKGTEELAYVRRTAVLKESVQFSECLKSCGFKLPVDGDFQVPRFTVLVGYIPTYQAAMVLQEEGRVIRWNSRTKKLNAIRLVDFKNIKATEWLKISTKQEEDCEFLERHSVPWFYSIDDNAGFIFGNTEKPRNTTFVPKKTTDQLYNMSRTLVLSGDVRIAYNGTLQAGDVVRMADETSKVVMTAVHVFKSGTDGSQTQEDYTRLWLGEVKQ